MDPSKRICLKNLPDNVTKREIAELVRNRTGAQPHSIDLGLDANGSVRRYAHFSCEGAKNVLEVLQNGVVMQEQTVYGLPAKPHYSFALAEARRKREREEESERVELQARLDAVKARALERTHGGELSKTRTPKKSAFSVKPKYGLVASELAKKYRDAYRQRHGKPTTGDGGGAAGGESGRRAMKFSRGDEHPNGASSTAASGGAAATREQRGGVGKNALRGKRGAGGGGTGPARRKEKVTTTTAAAAPIVAPPPQPPQPTKEEKKLSGLQARLAALKEKLKKA